MRRTVVTAVVALTAAIVAGGAPSQAALPVVVRTLDGSGNNVLNPDWGKAGTQYVRVAAPNYADGVSKMLRRSLQ